MNFGLLLVNKKRGLNAPYAFSGRQKEHVSAIDLLEGDELTLTVKQLWPQVRFCVSGSVQTIREERNSVTVTISQYGAELNHGEKIGSITAYLRFGVRIEISFRCRRR